MGLVVVANGKISSSVITPKHDATVHEHSAVDGEVYSMYFPEPEAHTSTLVGLGTKTEAGNVVTVGSGAGVGSSRFVKATTFTASASTAVFRFKISAITNGAGAGRYTLIGLSSDFTELDPESANNIIFYQDTFDDWYVACKLLGGGYYLQGIPALSAGDILTISVNTSNVYFYVNTDLVGSVPASDIPTGAMGVGFSCIGSAGTVTNTRELAMHYFAPSTTVAAADVTNTPAGDIAATDVQAAINELDTEKSATGHTHTYLPLGGGALTGAVTTNSTFDGVDVSALALTQQNVSILTPGAAPSLDPTLGSVFTLTPDQACTINMTGHVAGQVFNIIMTSTGTSRVVTYGTGFKGSSSTTVAGSAGDKYITQWVDDGTDALYRGSGGPF